jgi:hypothetical protein
LFSNQGSIYDFYGSYPPARLATVGYFLFNKVMIRTANYNDYTFAAAGGVIFTVVVAPIALLVKWALEKFGPSAEY